MKELILKPDLRRLELIQLLNSEVLNLTPEDIAVKLDCKVRVIKEDIAKINRESSGMFRIYTQDNKARIDFKKNIGIDYVIRLILKNTLSFKIIEKSFFNHNLSLEQAAEELFMSPSSLYRYVDLINSMLKKKFNIQMITNTFQITGDEEGVRYFYIQYFLERYLIGEWPFEDIIPEKYVDALLRERIEQTNFKMNISKFHQMKFKLAVKLIRIKKGFRLEHNEADLGIYEDMTEDFNKKFYNRSVGLKYTPDILFELSDCLIKESEQFSFSNYITKVNEDAEYNRIFLKMYRIISTLNNEFEINPIVKDLLIYNLHMTYENGIKDIDACFMLHDSKETFVNDLKISYRTFYNRAEELFKEFLLSFKNTVDENLLRQLMYILFTKWENLTRDLLGTIDHIKILVISKYDGGHAKIMQEFMGFERWKKANLVVSLMDDGSNENIDVTSLQERFDIVIANFSLTANDKLNFIRVNDMPTFRDLKIVYHEINKLIIFPVTAQTD